MSRLRFDGRLVTHCDSCGDEIEESLFVGSLGLTELLGLGFCPSCAEEQGADFASALLRSGLLSQTGKAAVTDWLQLQGPPDLRDLADLLRNGRGSRPLDRFREN